MINSLIASAFLDFLKNEWLGLVASAFVLVSFLFTKQTIIRLVNMVGCVVFVIYGILLPAYSTAIMNGALFIVHVVYLVKDFVSRKKNNATGDQDFFAIAESQQENDATQQNTKNDN